MPTRLQRSEGSLALRFARREGGTAPVGMAQAGSLRVRFPRIADSRVPEGVMINTAGGLAGGDFLHVRVDVEDGAEAVLCSQACEKVYRSIGGPARVRNALTLEKEAALSWLPQPSILFDQARLDREMLVSMPGDAKLLALEACILGRTAMGEEVRRGGLRDVWRISRDGCLVYADAIRLAGAMTADLASPWALDRYRAYANLVYVAPDAQSRREEMRSIVGGLQGRGATSAWNGLLVTRLVAGDGYGLMADLTQLLTQFRKCALPRLWSM